MNLRGVELLPYPKAQGPREVFIWRSDKAAPVCHRFDGVLVLDHALLGPNATVSPEEAPVLTLDGSMVTVQVRKKKRFVLALPGRCFDDFPGHPGALGHHWTWVAHPDRDEILALVSKQLPRKTSHAEGILRLHRLQVRPILGHVECPIRVALPCVIVVGLGAVSIGSSPSARPSHPGPLAKIDLDDARRRLLSLRVGDTALTVPSALPFAPWWQEIAGDAASHLTEMLDATFKHNDAPEWLLLPCYLPGSAPGLVLARQVHQRWVLTSSDEAPEDWIRRWSDAARESTLLETPGLPGPTRPSASDAAVFKHDDFTVSFEVSRLMTAARDIILVGEDFKPENLKRGAAPGAWRRAACVYALHLRPCALRDLRECGWSDGMARCVEDFVEDLGDSTLAWLERPDGPRIFADKFTVRGRNDRVDAREALATIVDTLVRPHGKTRTGGPQRRPRTTPSGPEST